MAWGPARYWLTVIGGVNKQDMTVLRQDRELMELASGDNLIPDPVGKLVTAPSSTEVRATAMSGSPAVTGLFHQLRDRANVFILGGQDALHQDSANPPAAISGGTAFTDSADNLLRADVHEALLIIVSRQRDLPQTINTSVTRADLGGTPPRGLDYKVFGRRGFMISPSIGGTIHYEKASYNSANDDHDAWTAPGTVNFLNFGREGSGVSTLGGEVHANHLMVYTQDKVFPVYTTPNALAPFAIRDEVFSEDGGGPVGAHAIVSGGGKVFWVSRNFDVKRQRGFSVESIGYAVQPFLRGLNQARMDFVSGGFDPRYRIVWWAVSESAQSTHNILMGVQADTEQFYFRTLARNAFGYRVVSGEPRLIGGDYGGKFYNEFDGNTTVAIDADGQTPPLHLGMPNEVKKVPYVAFRFAIIGSASVTISHRIDDAASWTEFTGSPVTISGNRIETVQLPMPQPFEHLELRFRNNTSGERFRLLGIGFPQPVALRTVVD